MEKDQNITSENKNNEDVDINTEVQGNQTADISTDDQKNKTEKTSPTKEITQEEKIFRFLGNKLLISSSFPLLFVPINNFVIFFINI